MKSKVQRMYKCLRCGAVISHKDITTFAFGNYHHCEENEYGKIEFIGLNISPATDSKDEDPEEAA